MDKGFPLIINFPLCGITLFKGFPVACLDGSERALVRVEAPADLVDTQQDLRELMVARCARGVVRELTLTAKANSARCGPSPRGVL